MSFTNATLPTNGPALSIPEPGEVTVGSVVAGVDVAALRVDLDDALADAMRRATTRAEHIRLTRIAGLIRALGLTGG